MDFDLWWKFSSELRDVRRPVGENLRTVPNVSTATMARLGWLFTDKQSSFVRFPIEKPVGVIRVGAIGDSFTYGDEVGKKSDYPSQLHSVCCGSDALRRSPGPCCQHPCVRDALFRSAFSFAFWRARTA